MKIVRLAALYWFPVLLWALIIFLFSAHPSIETTEIRWQDFIVKKTAHFVEYFIFATLLFRAFSKSGFVKSSALVGAVLISILYAMSDEFHQSFTPGRDPRIRDVVIDTIGATFAGLFIWKLQHKMPKPLKTLAKNMELV